jgi:hypothetical protein
MYLRCKLAWRIATDLFSTVTFLSEASSLYVASSRHPVHGPMEISGDAKLEWQFAIRVQITAMIRSAA